MATSLKRSTQALKQSVRNETLSKSKLQQKDPSIGLEATTSGEFGFPNDFIWFNRMIGNPVSKITNVVQDMAPFQEEYHDAIQEHHTIEFNKSRKLGATETFNRSGALNLFSRYAGHDVMIVAGNEVKIAKEILIRFDELFEDRRQPDGEMYAFKELTPGIIDEMSKYKGKTWQERLAKYDIDHKRERIKHDMIVKKANFAQNPTLEIFNGARVMAYAASRQEKAQSFRGADDVICAFVSEAAHTGMKMDQPIMTALEPNLAQRDDGDLILESTPNGRRGFFYEYWRQTMRTLSDLFKIPMTEHQILVDKINKMWKEGKKITVDIDWWPLMHDYRIGLKHHILSQKYIDKQRRNPKLDFDQEYCCKFTSTYTQAIKTEDLTFKDTTSKEYKKSIDLLGEDGIDKGYDDPGYR